MRSRFSAFARRDEAYLLRSWHPSRRPKGIKFDDDLRWTRLEVLGHTGGSLFESEGTVAFAAHYVENGRSGVMRENSTFVREGGQWFYVSGE